MYVVSPTATSTPCGVWVTGSDRPGDPLHPGCVSHAPGWSTAGSSGVRPAPAGAERRRDGAPGPTYVIPGKGRPAGITPSLARRSTALGITPSPQALSTGPSAARSRDPQPGLPGLERGGQPHRPAAGDEHVGLPGQDRSRRRRQRQRRVLHAEPDREQRVLSTVKTRAVIHAVWTSGRANPSTTTAT